MNILIGLLFFFSGMTSLVYQAVWIRSLSLGVGSTSTSMSIVLSIFFFGLSVGSFLTGRWIHKIKKPILFYGLIEAFIGIYAIALIYLLTDFHSLLAWLPLTGSFSAFGTFCKFALVFILLVAPTLCMGASLPLLIHFFIKEDKSVGKLVSLLYGINTLGAVIGAFLAGFYFIPQHGIILANHTMAFINVLILIAAYLLQKKVTSSQKHLTKPKSEQNVLKQSPFKFTNLNTLQKWILVSCGLTGFSSIAAEVMWNKYLGIFLGSNIFGLSLILSLFLLGIALGSLLLASFIDRIKNLVNFYILMLFMASLMMLGASHLLNIAPIITNVISYYIGNSISLLVIKSLVSGVILFLPTCFFGILLPLSIKLLTRSAKTAAAVTGVTYSINTIGAILGSYLAGIILIPMLGSGKTLQIAICLLLGMGIILTLVGFKGRILKPLVLTLFGGFIFLSLTSEGISFKNIIKSAYYQVTPDNLSLSEALKFFSEKSEDFQLIVEGRTGIISLSQSPHEAENWQDYVRLKTNGLNESLYDLKHLEHLPKYEALLGLLPYALVDKPKNAFVVGYGGGYTVDFLSSTHLSEVYVAELEQGIIDAAQFIYKGKNPILKRKNVNLKIEDARFVLAAQLAGPFDIIVSQPSHSWLSGVANLFTSEYFEIVKSNLTDRGVFSQWLNLYNMDATILKSVLHTFYKTFPHGAVFSDLGDEELIMIGSRHPVQFNMKKLNSLFKRQKFKRQFDEFKTPHDLLATFSLDRKTIVQLTKGAPLNTDINAYAEVKQSQLFYQHVTDQPGKFLIENYQANLTSVLAAKDASSIAFDLNLLDSLKNFPGESRAYQKFYVALERFSNTHASDPKYFEKLGEYNFYLERLSTAKSYLKKSMIVSPNVNSLDLLLRVSMAAGDYQAAHRLYSKHTPYHSKATTCYAIGIMTHNSNWQEAKKLVTSIMSDYTTYEAICGSYLWNSLGLYHFYNGRSEDAIAYLQMYYDEDPQDLRNLELLIAAFFSNGNSLNGQYYSSIYQEVFATEKERLKNLANFFDINNLQKDADVIRKKLAKYQERHELEIEREKSPEVLSSNF